MPGPVLTRRALNRATLARQFLLERTHASVPDVVSHLVGMQAQVPNDPYLGLWSRVARFQPEDLATPLVDREVVRIVTMRGTLHLVTAADCLPLRTLAQPILEREMKHHRDYAPPLADVDIAAVTAVARPLLAEAPRTGPQLRALLGERFPNENAAALAFACRNSLPLVQVPPRGVWGKQSQVTLTTADAWLGVPPTRDADVSIDDVVVRYLGAFGPATVADVAAWSGLTGMREVIERLRPRLVTFRDENGREVFDVEGAPLPDGDSTAPPRFLPEYDNVLLSHADRSRFISEEARTRLSLGTRTVRGSVLCDGVLVATWRISLDDDCNATLHVDLAERVTKKATSAIEREGRAMLSLLEPDRAHEVRFIVVGSA